MLKHQEILQKLTIEQKLSLLADFNALGDVPESKYGVKFVKSIGAFEHPLTKDYPKPESLVNSFNDELFAEMADDIAQWHHDLEDALREGTLPLDRIRNTIESFLGEALSDEDRKKLNILDTKVRWIEDV